MVKAFNFMISKIKDGKLVKDFAVVLSDSATNAFYQIPQEKLCVEGCSMISIECKLD